MALRNIELEILEFNYWEHFKMAKDLSLILPLGHEKRVKLEDEMEKLITRINEIKNKVK